MKLKWKKVLTGMVMGVVIILIVAFLYIFSYVRTFTHTSRLSFSELMTIFREGYRKQETYKNKQITFFFMGLDKRSDEFERTLLTDTILIGSINSSDGAVRIIPIPRDLWISDLQTKINALYFYGQQDITTSGFDYTTKEIKTITGIEPDFTIVLNYLDLPNLINIIGGVDVPIEKSFEDNKYPNPSFIIGSGSSGTPYMTVKFEKGNETMDGDRALSYIRSRGSSDPEEGSDIARSKRQMIVLTSLIKKLKSREVLQNPEKIGKLYQFWKNSIQTTLTDSDVVGLGLTLRNRIISIESKQIPTVSASDQQALLVNPPISKYGLWVWEPTNNNWNAFSDFFKQNLYAQ